MRCEPAFRLLANTANGFLGFILVLLSIFSFIGLLYGNPTNEPRFFWMFLNLFGIGVGSVALHATLDWFSQSMDEVPMLWANLFYLYNLQEMDSPKHKKRINHLEWYLIAFGVFQTVIYYKMQSLYVFFIVTYTTMAAVVIIWSGHLAIQNQQDKQQEAICRNLYFGAVGCYVIVGSIVWLLDMHRQ